MSAHPSALSAASLPQLSGYELGSLLHAGVRSLVYRAVELADCLPVVLKFHRDPYPSDRQIATQQRAYDIARQFSPDLIVAHLALLPCGNAQALVTEDFGARSLDQVLLEHGPPTPRTVLEIGVALARALADLHRGGVVHKDLKPGHILWHADRAVLKLTDLGACSRLRQEPVQPEGGLALPDRPLYIAPEQTGQMNRPVDLRADLYAVGAVLFELFTGAPPFVSDDPKELVHAHLARRPPDLRDRRADLHPAVAAIIDKLLQKNQDARYATADGLAADLQRCLDEMDQRGAAPFALGTLDALGRFRLPDRLYGRETEIGRLSDAVERAAAGHRQCLLVAGYSGIGKSALIAEAQVPIAARHGWFCTGKFDQFRRDLPYLAWREALGSLVHQVMALPEAEVRALRDELSRKLAGNGALIADLVPGGELLLGKQVAPPDVGPELGPELGPTEAQARFDQALRVFLRVLASASHPLVLFVDDLQWADLPSLRLFESLTSDPAPAHLLVLGAYRDNEVGPGHPLIASINRLEEVGKQPTTLTLPPLTTLDVDDLVADTLHLEQDEAAPLAELVFRKTAGNPFFVRQFLTTLSNEELVAFDRAAGCWRWDLDAIDRKGYTDNVVDLVGGCLRELPAETLRTLQLGACLGASFDLQGLLRISDRSAVEVAEQLEAVLKTGLLLPMGADYRLALTDAVLAQRTGRSLSVNPRYAFLHDRVHQSAHESVAAADRALIHLRIARELVAGLSIDSEQGQSQALDVMDHLAESLDRLDDAKERLRFARVCLAAGQRASASMATAPAVGYLEMGRRLLPQDGWTAEPELALGLHLAGADACYVAERYEEADALARRVLAQVDSLQHRVAAYNVLIGIGVAQRRYVEATMLGLDVLEQELGLRLPRRAGMPRVLAGVLRTRLALRGLPMDTLLRLPPMDDERAQAAVAVLMKCATNAYWGNPRLVPLIAGQMVRLSLRSGNTGLSAYGYVLFGMIITNAVDAVDAGYALGKLAMDLLERRGERQLVGKTGLLWHGFIRHAKDPLRLCAADTLACYDHAIAAGDVENAVYCGTVAYFSDLLAGRSLEWIEQRYADYLPALLNSSQAQTTFTLRVWMQAAANLADAERIESKTVGALIDWPTRLAEMLDDPTAYMTIATVAGAAGWLAFLLDDLPEAERQFRLLYERADAALGQPFWKPCMALYGVTLCRKRAAGNAGPADRLRLVRIHRWVRKWARRNAHDYAAYERLLAAETAVIGDRRWHGRERELAACDDAAALAHESGNLFLEALATERAAHAHGRAGHRDQAHALLNRASHLWQRHGASARLRLLRARNDAAAFDRGGSTLGSIDFDALLGAIRAVSESIEVEQLVDRVLQISLIRSGGRRTTLLLQEEALRPFASAVIDDQGRFKRLDAAPRGEAEQLPLSLLDYVVRTRKVIVVDNAVTHEWLSRDPYVACFERLSLMGIPLLRQGRLLGMVLLENDLVAGVFSDLDAKVAEAVAGQAAVSLENARLFETRRRQAEAFARFLPRPFLEQLGHHNAEDVRLGDGIQRRVTVMFTDLRGFTSLSERLGVRDNFALVNGFLARMAPALTREGGFIDEFLGDGIKALFIDQPDGAVRAAIAMQHQLRQYNVQRAQRGREPLAMGIGVHSGSVLLGTIGAGERMSTTVIGDTVNATARLEGLTKIYGTPVLISEQTRADLADPMAFSLRLIGRIRVKGRREPILVHEVVDARAAAERDLLMPLVPRFNAAVAAYFERRFQDAADGFSACAAAVPTERLCSDYLSWTAACLEQGVADDWDGVIERMEK